MGKISLLILGLFVTGMMQAQDITGNWHGTLEFTGGKLRLIFHIQESDGNLSATMDSPDQGAFGIPVESVELKGNDLTIRIPRLMVEYTATVEPEGKKMKGNFKQGAADLPLDLNWKVREKPEYDRPQEPRPPYPYREEPVSYNNPQASGVTLAGTLTLPQEEGPFPAVILISGSGPQDRNEEIMGHKPFLVIADHLTRAGIAVLRFDDRGVGKSTGNFGLATSADFASDVRAGIAFLKNRREIDAGQIGLVGHSEGGLIGPMVAAGNEDVAFLIMLAGPGVNGEEVVLLQLQSIGRAEGGNEQSLEASRKLHQQLYKVLRETPDNEAARKKLAAIIQEEIDKLPDEVKANLGDMDKVIDGQLNILLSPWVRFFLTYDPLETLKKVTCPVLALNGDKDLQVDADQNLPNIAKALKEGGNTRVTTRALPGLNHLFQHSETGKFSEYSQLSETFAPEVLELMTNWIRKQL